MNFPRLKTPEGFDIQFGTNHLGHFLLTEMIMPKIKASAESGFHPRIIILTSIAHAKVTNGTNIFTSNVSIFWSGCLMIGFEYTTVSACFNCNFFVDQSFTISGTHDDGDSISCKRLVFIWRSPAIYTFGHQLPLVIVAIHVPIGGERWMGREICVRPQWSEHRKILV